MLVDGAPVGFLEDETKQEGTHHVCRKPDPGRAEGVFMAIKRIWHGWTTPENAESYGTVLREKVIPGIEAKQIPGYRGFEVLRRPLDKEMEFVTIITFDSLESVVSFVGEDYSRAYVPDVAQEVLSRWDLTCAHYEVLDERVGTNA